MGLKKEKTVEELFGNTIEFREYSDSELQDFHNKVQRFYFTYETPDGQKSKVLNAHKLKVAFGAIGERGGIVLSNVIRRDNGSIQSYTRPTRLEEFDNLFKQWQDWKLAKGIDDGLAGRQKRVQFDEIAQQHPTNKKGLWICPNCNTFEGTYEQIQDHRDSCVSELASKMTVEPAPEDIPF